MPHDEQFRRLERIAEPLKGEKEARDAEEKAKMWQGSPFAWVYPLPSAAIGKIGRKLVERLCRDDGLVAHRPGYRVRVRGAHGPVDLSVKFSVLGLSQEYFFENVQDSGYDFLFCLGVSPGDVHAWVIPLEKFQTAKDQHGKADKWMTFNPKNPPELFRECGPDGNLDEALKALRGHLGM